MTELFHFEFSHLTPKTGLTQTLNKFVGDKFTAQMLHMFLCPEMPICSGSEAMMQSVIRIPKMLTSYLIKSRNSTLFSLL